MTSVTPVFTEYERRVVHEIARPSGSTECRATNPRDYRQTCWKIVSIARDSQNPALKGISERVQGWVQEGLIKTVQAANQVTGTEEIIRRVEAMDIHVADIESMRYLPMSKLDQIADSFKTQQSHIAWP